MQVAALLRGVDKWQFDTFALDEATGGRPLSFLAFHLISKAGLVERLHLDAIKLARWGKLGCSVGSISAHFSAEH